MQRLKEVRNQRGLSQGRLAELSGVSRPSIARIETRTDYTPRDTTIRSLTETLGVIDVELLSDEEFGHELESATLDQLLKLNRDLSRAAEEEDLETDRHRHLVERVDKVVEQFTQVAGPFTLAKRWDEPAPAAQEAKERAG
ncbi:MAG TPA: helix-turn-helix transcriptional regulator [Rubrobacteraceae bacterium]|nr:helix-turn-helix transcriptional regulator [Rubrobacteraceae bacterium]